MKLLQLDLLQESLQKKKVGRPKIETKSKIYYGWNIYPWLFEFSFDHKKIINVIRLKKKGELEEFSHEIFSKLNGVLDASCNLEHRPIVREFAEGIPESVYMEKVNLLNEKYKFLHPDNGIFVPLTEFGITRPDSDWQKKK